MEYLLNRSISKSKTNIRQSITYLNTIYLKTEFSRTPKTLRTAYVFVFKLNINILNQFYYIESMEAYLDIFLCFFFFVL